jgi:rhamnogalacturonan endolyase
VHFQEMGAIEMAKLVVQGIRGLSSDANVSKLIPFLVPTYKVTFTSNNSAAGLITRTEFFPAGITVTAYAWPNAGFTFLNWSGSITGTKRNITFVMGTAAKTINATFSGGTGATTYPAENAVLSGTGISTETTNAGFHDSAYVNFPTTGGTATFNNINGGSGGAKTLVVRFANGSTAARSGQLVVNGTTSTITFNPSGTWTTWANQNVAITLASGTANTIQLKSTGGDLANIDEITVQ